MAIKKSELYSSLWASCDELRGGTDDSQYKDYVLFMLFIKYISDKYANSDDYAPPVTIPKGASFADMLDLRSQDDIQGDAYEYRMRHFAQDSGISKTAVLKNFGQNNHSKDLIEHVIVHEMVHLLEPTHSDRFVSLLTKHYPTWREAAGHNHGK